MNIKELETRYEAIEKELQRLKDIEAIRKLQHVYGYYLTTWMNEELMDLFADNPETTIDFPQGTFLGKKGVRIAFGYTNKNMNPEYMHQLMQLQGVIDIAADGKTAKGRWWGFGAMAVPEYEWVSDTEAGGGISQTFACGVYENEYIKEEGVWKIWKLKWIPLYHFAPEEGWVKPERLLKKDRVKKFEKAFPKWWQPDIPDKGIDFEYPSGYILPFHFKHPVTGKKSTEAKRNVRIKGVKK